LALIEGMAMQMPMDAIRGDVVLPRSRLLEQPDPMVDRAWFVGMSWDDYLVHGNAVHLVTSRDAQGGWPASVMRLPPELVDMTVDPEGRRMYWLQGVELPIRDVVHVPRGSDPLFPGRGVGILEQHMRALSRMDKQGRYEESVLDGAAVPSAVVSVVGKPSQEEMDDAADRWMKKFSGPQRRPVFLPDGAVVTPLSWSPSDSQLVEARQLSLTDAANVLNLDAFWVGGAIASGLTYRSPGPMWLNLLRQTVAPILEQFELTWSQAWLPRGQRVKFARRAVLEDDMGTTVGWVDRGVKGGLMTLSEGRVFLGLSAEVPAELRKKPQPAALVPAVPGPDEAPDQDNEDDSDEQEGGE
jgi:phage portal protein BeeE